MPNNNQDPLCGFLYLLFVISLYAIFIENGNNSWKISKENCTITTIHDVNVIKTRLKTGFSLKQYIQRTPKIEYYTDIEKQSITTCCDGYGWQSATDFCEPLCYPYCSDYEDTTNAKEHTTEIADGNSEGGEMQTQAEEEEEEDEVEVEGEGEEEEYITSTTLEFDERAICSEGHIYYKGSCRSLEINNSCNIKGCSVEHSICLENGDCECKNGYTSHTEQSKLIMCVPLQQNITETSYFLIYIGIGTLILLAFAILLYFCICLRKRRGHMTVEDKNLQCVYMKTTDTEISKSIIIKEK